MKDIRSNTAEFGVTFFGMKRVYEKDLFNDIEIEDYAKPFLVSFDYGVVSMSRNWKSVICDIVVELQRINHKALSELYLFSTEWCSEPIFSDKPIKELFDTKIMDCLYLVNDFSAKHYCYLINELLNYYGVGKEERQLQFTIPYKYEDEKLKERISNNVVVAFVQYLMKECKIESIYKVNRILDGVHKINEKIKVLLPEIENIYLVDDIEVLNHVIRSLGKTLRTTYLEYFINFFNWLMENERYRGDESSNK